MLKILWYNFIKAYIKTGLFFYSKEIKVVGLENIPKKGAVLFAANHPNGLLDPLVISTYNPRINHFLVRAAAFKKPLAKKFLSSLNLMPIYRIRDGKSQVSRNHEVFNTCFEILKNEKALMIFPEGSHGRVRKIRPISKGFTRIIFGALDKYPELNITIIPVGLTYQNPSVFPSKIAMHYGKPIIANKFYHKNDIINSTNKLKTKVKESMEEITVCIKDEEKYEQTLSELNTANIDFTEIDSVNTIIKNQTDLTPSKEKINYIKPLIYLILINSILPYFIWKIAEKKVDEIEFVDTFRFGLGIVTFPLFYLLQSLIVFYFFGSSIALYYFLASFLIVLIYTKLSVINSEE
ncbi:1-acyl-sn-glycerol-3-phosphate acyltransferase [Lutibacter sp. Hel_I_33_5]|uniref:lysophospholipid acyltransferase family protein n=1 Tax=Lutibacter sp. Hel_I_33_5 TaxID=1566289 RepID=UPI00119E08F4|nr:lysophospholipid acyltransferase family protein [Lutibacter sp. Hel_I_33_5]TVZ55731.1 1-acyl-sn-glycerol-3-phosphate acyltransferase [Lutibacter sp. Hel_I_33_5]